MASPAELGVPRGVATRVYAEVFLVTGVPFGVVFGTVCGVFIGLTSWSITAGLVGGALCALVTGLAFGGLMALIVGGVLLVRDGAAIARFGSGRSARVDLPLSSIAGFDRAVRAVEAVDGCRVLRADRILGEIEARTAWRLATGGERVDVAVRPTAGGCAVEVVSRPLRRGLLADVFDLHTRNVGTVAQLVRRPRVP